MLIQFIVEGLRATLCFSLKLTFERRGTKCFQIGYEYKGWQMAKELYRYDGIDFIALYFFITWIYIHVTICYTFWRTMVSRFNTLLHGGLHL